MQICGITILNEEPSVTVADQPSDKQKKPVVLVDPFAKEPIELDADPSVHGLPAHLAIVLTRNGGDPRQGYITNKRKFDAFFYQATGNGVNFGGRNTFNLSGILPVALREGSSRYRNGVARIATMVGMEVPTEINDSAQV